MFYRRSQHTSRGEILPSTQDMPGISVLCPFQKPAAKYPSRSGLLIGGLVAFWLGVFTIRPVFAVVVFDFTFEDVVANTNDGFDDPVLGADRRAALIDVANNVIGKQLDHQATVRININESKDLSDNTLATAGQIFFVVRRSFQDGLVAAAIQEDEDPSPGNFLGSMTWDFTHDWNLSSESPASGENDFRSVALHELTHLLGFATLIRENGHGLEDVTFDTFSRFDSFLENSTGSPLITSGRFNVVNATISDLTTAVFFNGTHATAANDGDRVELFADAPFGHSSLSHMRDTNDPMTVNLPIGSSQRAWSLLDRGILLDLGYQIPDAVISNLDEVLTDTTLTITGSMFVGGDQFGAQMPGSLTVEDSAAVNVLGIGGIWETGTLHVQGTFSTDGALANKGDVDGAGTIGGDLTNLTGTIAPGAPIGRLGITQNFIQDAGGRLEMEIGGTTPATEFDVLEVGNAAQVGGILEIHVRNAYRDLPSRGLVDRFHLLTSQQLTGTFDQISYAGKQLAVSSPLDDRGSFSSHQGNGYFRTVLYSDEGLEFINLYAQPGDLDGDVDIDLSDFNVLAAHFDPFNLDFPHNWLEGDFDGDQKINLTDFNFMAANFSLGSYNLGGSSLLSTVPEPNSALSCAVLIACLTLLRNAGCREPSGPGRHHCRNS
ncbi:MAG: hypothetical protein CMJ81_22245 [Planctomycetaceae bacterium]|nr:hypothetical protein [Planctomycetaceae bacterium]MBP63214.1 hypothetical protein [Planctomycetaceae bacterium]